eukprot:1525707-Rhodomonas_salina.2
MKRRHVACVEREIAKAWVCEWGDMGGVKGGRGDLDVERDSGHWVHACREIAEIGCGCVAR